MRAARVVDLDLVQTPSATLVARGGVESGLFGACVSGWDCGMGRVANNTFSRLKVLYHLVLGELLFQEVGDGEKSIVLG